MRFSRADTVVIALPSIRARRMPGMPDARMLALALEVILMLWLWLWYASPAHLTVAGSPAHTPVSSYMLAPCNAIPLPC